MSHGDTAVRPPPGFTVTARTGRTPVAAMEDGMRPGLYGVQFHPEVAHTEHGTAILCRFLDAAGCRPTWTARGVIEEQVRSIREQIGGGRAICGLSGGVDSAVAAALVQRAIGSQLTCVFVDHGLLREGEAEQVERDFVAATGVRLHTVPAADTFLRALAGVTDPEAKRKVIGREFIRAFEGAARDIAADAGSRGESVEFLVQEHLVPGRGRVRGRHRDGEHQVASQRRRAAGRPQVPAGGAAAAAVQGRGAADRHRAGPACRRIVWRQPFPGPGLGIRIIGEITPERLRVLRAADAIARAELSAAGLDRDIWQCPVVLLADVRSVGVQGDGRSSRSSRGAAPGGQRGTR